MHAGLQCDQSELDSHGFLFHRHGDGHHFKRVVTGSGFIV